MEKEAAGAGGALPASPLPASWGSASATFSPFYFSKDQFFKNTLATVIATIHRCQVYFYFHTSCSSDQRLQCRLLLFLGGLIINMYRGS